MFSWRADNTFYGSRKSYRAGSPDMHGTPPRHRRIICEDRYPAVVFPQSPRLELLAALTAR